MSERDLMLLLNDCHISMTKAKRIWHIWSHGGGHTFALYWRRGSLVSNAECIRQLYQWAANPELPFPSSLALDTSKHVLETYSELSTRGGQLDE